MNQNKLRKLINMELRRHGLSHWHAALHHGVEADCLHKQRIVRLPVTMVGRPMGTIMETIDQQILEARGVRPV